MFTRPGSLMRRRWSSVSVRRSWRSSGRRKPSSPPCTPGARSNGLTRLLPIASAAWCIPHCIVLTNGFAPRSCSSSPWRNGPGWMRCSPSSSPRHRRGKKRRLLWRKLPVRQGQQKRLRNQHCPVSEKTSPNIVQIGPAEASQEPALPRPQSALHALKHDAGPLGLSRVLEEIAKLERIHQLGLPADLFAHVSAKTLDSYRHRIAVEDLQEVRRHPGPIRFTLLAAYCWRRRQEIVDILVELLLDVAHHLTTRAERRVEKAFVKDIKKVSGKTTLLFRLAEAAIDKPDGSVREVVFPVVSEQTLRDLVKEYKA